MTKELEFEGKVKEGKIHDVIVRNLVTHSDDRGSLTESMRQSWTLKEDTTASSNNYITDDIKQVYFITNHEPNTIRGFHKHDKLIDWFTIASGAAMFVLFDDRPDSPTFGVLQKVTVSAEQKKTVFVPAGVHHGWKSLQPNTLLISQASEEYNSQNPDEYRIPYTAFGRQVWRKKII